MLYLLIFISLFIETFALANEPTNVMEQILSGYDQIKKQSTCSENKKDGFYIFVSLSMPKSLLKQYEQIAKKIGAKLVLRGFKNNSFKETIKVTKEIAMQVDPVAFKKFEITLVPSFVLSNNDKFDKLAGNVSIKYALEQFEQQGDLKTQATEYLKRLK